MENLNPETNKINPGISSPAVEIKISETDGKPVFIDFGGPALTADAGALLLKEVEEQLGIIEKMSAVIRDDRDARYVKHTLTALLVQRVSQIACGYEDANDCNILRSDPVFKMIAGRCPETGEVLCSRPAAGNRFENSVSRMAAEPAEARICTGSLLFLRRPSCRHTPLRLPSSSLTLTIPKTKSSVLSSFPCSTDITGITVSAGSTTVLYAASCLRRAERQTHYDNPEARETVRREADAFRRKED